MQAPRPLPLRFLLVFSFGWVLSGGAEASGFGIPEGSVAGLALANAMVANPEELGAMEYNPAAMGFLAHSAVSLGAKDFAPDLKVTTASGKHDSRAEDNVFIPDLHGLFKIGDRWNLGLGVSAPFGLETSWPVGTFPALSQSIPVAPGVSLPPGLFHPTQSKLVLAQVAPSIAYKVSDNLSVSAGVDYFNAPRVALNTGFVKIEGDGDAWGWNLGVMYRTGPLSLGASYHAATTLRVDGNYIAHPALAPLGIVSQAAKADLDLPSRLQLGVRYAFSEHLAAEFDWTRTGWSDFDALAVTSKVNGATLARNVNHWDDANAYRLGLTWQVTPAAQLRLGYAYDETGQGNDHLTARIPDADRQLFSIGGAYAFGQGWELEVGYMYVLLADRNFRGDRPFSLVDKDPNGTTAYDGDYEASVNIFGLGITKHFL